MSSGLYDSLGWNDFFAAGSLIGSKNISASGKSDVDEKTPFSWNWNVFGSAQGVLDVQMKYDISQLIGNSYKTIGLADPMTKVNFSYNFGTNTYSKDVWLCPRFALRSNGGLNGNYLDSVEIFGTLSQNIGSAKVEADYSVSAPLKTACPMQIMSGAKFDLKLAQHSGYVAARVALDNLEKSDLKVGVEDEKMTVALEHKELKEWNFSIAKMVNSNTRVGFESDLTSQIHSIVASQDKDDSSLKLKLSNKDKILFTISKNWPSFSADIEMEAEDFISKSGACSVKFGYGLNFNL